MSSFSRILPRPAALRPAAAIFRAPSTTTFLLARSYSTDSSAPTTPGSSISEQPLAMDPSPEAIRFRQNIAYKQLHHQPTRTVEELLADPNLPYLVRRTPSAQLPIYNRWKAKSPAQTIVIKKVEGDKGRFVDDLVAAIGLDRANARINPYTGHIELKGNGIFVPARKWLLEKGF